MCHCIMGIPEFRQGFNQRKTVMKSTNHPEVLYFRDSSCLKQDIEFLL